jgi:hypothetical protein
MAERFNSAEVAYYFERFGFRPRQIGTNPHHDLGIIVVIPSYKEPGLPAALDSLWSAERPDCAVEIIVVINSSEGEAPDVLAANARSYAESLAFIQQHQDPRFQIHLLNCPDLPLKKAGVGLARKIGMDEALRRFDSLNTSKGVIACFDADCLCDPNYFRAIENWFADPAKTGCAIYFEHPLAGPEPPAIYEAIQLYELHLRCHLQGLRLAGFPHAFHTIGSSMAVRADVYRKQGGMNKRQAGEDFYFLHKIIPLGGFGDLVETRVIASPRSSNRVPFGTGRAVGDYLAGRPLTTYARQSYLDLRDLFRAVESIHAQNQLPALPASITAFLVQEQFELALKELRTNSATLINFRKRFFTWFDGFQAMKFLHFARDNFYPNQPVQLESSALHKLMTGDDLPAQPMDQLLRFRAWERSHPRFL